MTKAYELAKKILQANDQLLEAVAQKLLDVETLRKEEFEQLFRELGRSYNWKEGVFNE